MAGSCVKGCAPYPTNVFCPNAKKSLRAGSLTTVWERRRKGTDQGYNGRDNQYIGYRILGSFQMLLLKNLDAFLPKETIG